MPMHEFDTTELAYKASQTNSAIKNGDLLIIASEKVVGVADTWPFAVTMAHGSLHSIGRLAKPTSFSVIEQDAIIGAITYASKMRWPLDPPAVRLASMIRAQRHRERAIL